MDIDGMMNRNESIRAMVASGITRREVAETMGISAARISQITQPSGPARQRNRTFFEIPKASIHAICVEAGKRGVTPTKLARMILATVAEDDLFAAVLDDGDSAPVKDSGLRSVTNRA